MVELPGLGNGKRVGTTGTSSPTRKEDGTSRMNADSHRIYRRVVGKLLWLAPMRPDLSYVSKELSRTPQSSAQDDFRQAEARDALPQTGGELPHVLTTQCDYEMRRYLRRHYARRRVDSDWAGCTTTRKSTAACTITVRGVPIHHYARTQSTAALSSGNAELYGLSSGTTQTMGVSSCRSATSCRDQRIRHYVHGLHSRKATGVETRCEPRQEARPATMPVHPGLVVYWRCSNVEGSD